MTKEENDDIIKLHKNLILLHEKLREKRIVEQKRIDPFEELLFDRWEKAKFLKAKKQSSVYHNNYIAGKVTLGKNTWVGPFVILDGTGGGLKIGDFCSISSGVQIYTHNTVDWALSGGKSKRKTKSVSIGNNCYIGPNTIINMGVKIGNRCVIGAQSFINKDIPSNSIALGTPAKIVGKIKTKEKKIVFDYFQ